MIKVKVLTPWVTLRTVANGVTYSVVNPESKEVKMLELGHVSATTAGEELPSWVAPCTGETSLSSLQAATQASGANNPRLQALDLGEQLSDTECMALSHSAESHRLCQPRLPRLPWH